MSKYLYTYNSIHTGWSKLVTDSAGATSYWLLMLDVGLTDKNPDPLGEIDGQQ